MAKAARRSFSEGGLSMARPGMGAHVVRYVYLLQSIRNPDQRYVGITAHLKKRFQEHNAGKSPHTSRHRPWELVAAVRFENDARAAAFEEYLKSGSGRAFARRHFW